MTIFADYPKGLNTKYIRFNLLKIQKSRIIKLIKEEIAN